MWSLDLRQKQQNLDKRFRVIYLVSPGLHAVKPLALKVGLPHHAALQLKMHGLQDIGADDSLQCILLDLTILLGI